MTRNTTNIAKGIAIGLAAGAATYALVGNNKNTAKMIKKNANKVMRTVSNVVDNMSSMMR